jgi:hypothetical protein
VAREHDQTDFLLTNDPRFVRAIGVAIHHAAAHNAMSPSAETALVHATENLCHVALRNGNGHDPALRVSVQEYPDRVEVLLEHPGKPLPEPKKPRSRKVPALAVGFAPASEPTGRVDRIVRECNGEFSSIRLVQYCSSRHPHA